MRPDPKEDLRAAWRGLRQAPGVALAIVLSVGVAIGANVSVFSWVQAVLLRPIPGAADPSRLFVLGLERRDGRDQSWSYPNLHDIREALTTVDVLGQDDMSMSVAVDGHAGRAYGVVVTGNYFQAMGVRAAVGRVFTAGEEDGQAGPHPVAVLSHAYWQRRFAASQAIVGRAVTINGVPMTVIGVTPPGFAGSLLGIATEVWVPLSMQPQVMGGDRLARRDSGWLQAYARLRPGVSRDEAQAEIDARLGQLARAYPETNDGLRARLLRPWEASFGVPTVLTPILIVLSILMVLVLALACANVTNLLLARAVDRRAEMAIRLSLGASRWRLLRQLLVESLLVAGLACGVGLVLAGWSHDVLLAFVPPVDVPIELGLRLDGATVAFAVIVSVATACLFGIAPALHASSTRPVSALGDAAGRGGVGGGRAAHRLRGGLVAVQVAASVLLLVCASLFARSLMAARHLDPGFDVAHQVVATIDPGANGYTESAGQQLYERVRQEVARLPGVESVALARLVPLGFGGWTAQSVTVDGYVPAPDEELVIAFNSVSPGYFQTMDVRVPEGRDFTTQDTEAGEPVVMVNQAMARRYWPGRSAVGGRIRFAGVAHRVVGVAPDIKQRRIDEAPTPFMYLPLSQAYRSAVSIQVRTTSDPAAQLAAIADVVTSLDANLPVFGARTMTEHTRAAFFPQRIAASLLGIMSLVAVVLAAIGLYGVVAHTVGQRRREIGVRLALGATPANVQRLAVRQGLATAAAGFAVGVLGARLAAGAMAALLPGIGLSDPVAFVAVPLGLAAVVFFAAWIPARRAAATDPAAALRAM